MVSRYFNGLMEMAGFFAIDEEITEHCRRRVHAKCSQAPVKLYSRRRAQTILELAACEAVVETFRDHYPDVDFKVQRTWPLANVIIKDDKATIDIWIGPDREGAEPPEPIEVTVERGGLDLSERISALLRRKPKEREELELTRSIAPPPPPKRTYSETIGAASKAAAPQKPAPAAPQPKPKAPTRPARPKPIRT